MNKIYMGFMAQNTEKQKFSSLEFKRKMKEKEVNIYWKKFHKFRERYKYAGMQIARCFQSNKMTLGHIIVKLSKSKTKPGPWKQLEERDRANRWKCHDAKW